MTRLRSFLAVVCLVAFLASCSDAGFRVTKEGWKVWTAPGGGWEVGGIGFWPVDRIVWAMERKPPDVGGLKVFEVIATEPGEWFTFIIKFGAVQTVVFTRDTKIVLIDKKGKRYESEACLFSPDMEQTQVYDARKMNVVVSNETIYCRPKDGRPGVAAKFAMGSVRRKDVVEFEVVGAIEVPPQDTAR